uniref:Uncharacterized protein n=1 Tax=Eutreptiella gymnastica TaxID=73025 RepID=A0A7S4FUR9_9EUGL
MALAGVGVADDRRCTQAIATEGQCAVTCVTGEHSPFCQPNLRHGRPPPVHRRPRPTIPCSPVENQTGRQAMEQPGGKPFSNAESSRLQSIPTPFTRHRPSGAGDQMAMLKICWPFIDS